MTDAHVLLPWQQRDWARLAPALSSGRLAHALLVTGAPGIGKRHLAGVLLRALLCESPAEGGRPCGACRGCVQMQAGSHPDFTQLQPQESGAAIRIAGIRDFVRTLYLTSQYGHGRAGLVQPAERLTTGAANSLLKALEEPPAGSHIVLVTDRPRAVLPTIRSRCQILRLRSPPADEAGDWLAQSAPPGTAALMPMVRGAPLRAARLAEDGIAEAQAGWFEDLRGLAEGRRDPVTVADGWLATDTAALLDWLYLACADLLKCRAGATSLLIFGDHADTLIMVADVLDAGRLRRLVPEIVRARRLLDSPVDTRLELESLCVALLECRRTRSAPRADAEARPV